MPYSKREKSLNVTAPFDIAKLPSAVEYLIYSYCKQQGTD